MKILPLLAVSLLLAQAQTPRITVKGLKADGVTDNAAAIQAAIGAVCASGGTLQFPRGVYSIGNGLQVASCHNVRFQGSSRAEIRFKAGTPDTLYSAWPNYGKDSIFRIMNSANITIDGLTLNGNLSNRKAYGPSESHNSLVLIVGSTNVHVQNSVLKEGMTDGVITVPSFEGQNNTNIWIEKNQIVNNRRNNISGVGQIGMWIRGNKITGAGTIQGTNPKAGIDIEPDKASGASRNVHIEGNTVSGSAGIYAVVITGLGTAGVTVANNIVHSNAAYAIDFQARNTGITLMRNTVYGHPAGCAVRVVGSVLDTVSGNTFRSNQCEMVRFSPDGKKIPF